MKLNDWTDQENEILFEGIKAGGAFLDDLGKTDLATLTKEELIQFMQCAVQTVTEKRLSSVSSEKRDAEFNDEIPF